jgi:small-conductance mechanosensitive channel
MDTLFEFLNHPTVVKTLKLVLWVAVIITAVGLLRKLAKQRIENSTYRYKTQKFIEIVGYILIALVIIMFATLDSVKDYTLIIGLFTAGITFTLQELILSVAGSFYIFSVRVYKPGDRIELNGITGDVIDIDSIYTTLMEIGEWVSTDNYSGRIVKISNAFVFKGPIKNYSMDFPFLWDELDLYITYGSDIEFAKDIILKEANEYLLDYTENSKAQWEAMVARYYIENAKIEPSLALTLTDNWMQLNLRYITDYRLRRNTKQELFRRIDMAVRQSAGKVTLASRTLQLLKIPEVDVHVR